MGILSLVLGVIAIIFAFDTPRRRFVALFKRNEIVSSSLSPVILQTPSAGPVAPTYGATQSGREPFFIREPHSTLQKAKAEAYEARKALFVVIYDQDHPSLSKLYYALGCFMEYFTTKKLVDDHFVVALLQLSSPGARQLVPENDPLECALWVVFSPSGDIVRRESVYANPDEGLRRVRKIVATLSDA